jgi:hypothetical protein
MCQCNNYCFGGHADRAGAAYLIGTKVPVYYDPKHPENAIFTARASIRCNVWFYFFRSSFSVAIPLTSKLA